MILVTGSSGFVGRSLMRALREAGRPAKTYTGRINDPLRLREELSGVKIVIHLAGSETRDKLRLLLHVDIEGTQRLIEECQRAEVERLIVVSRMNADPNSHYALLHAKGEVERLVRGSGIPYTILRSATLFGRGDRFLSVIADLAFWTWPFVWLPGGGRVAMQPLWVEDFVRCLLACLDRSELENQIVQVAGEERFHYSEIVNQVLFTAGLKRVPITPSLKLVRPFSLLIFGWRRHPPVTRFFLDRFSSPEVAPLDSVLHQFNFRPGHLGQHIAYLRPGARRRISFES
jgi:NADH dehydrogenase